MKVIHIASVAVLITGMLVAGGCSTPRGGSDKSKVTFLTEDCGEFTFQKYDVIAFLEAQKVKSPKAAEMLALLLDRQADSSVKLSCNEYCPILFNGMLAASSDFLVRCKDCKGIAPFEEIKGKLADASQKTIQYVDKGDHVLINIRLEK